MNLFKFRGLDKWSFSKVKEILETDKFWCDKLWNMNDPMEGVFLFPQGILNPKQLSDLFWEKNKTLLCSFCGPKAFDSPTMWGYYANGFKGVAIEIDATSEVAKKEILPMDYCESIADIDLSLAINTALRKVVTTKLSSWQIEDEYRFLVESMENKQSIGKITAVHFGDPLGDVKNANDVVANSRHWKDYFTYRDQLRVIAENKKIPCFKCRIEGSKVVSSPYESR